MATLTSMRTSFVVSIGSVLLHLLVHMRVPAPELEQPLAVATQSHRNTQRNTDGPAAR